jgi:hypothetical protein
MGSKNTYPCTIESTARSSANKTVLDFRSLSSIFQFLVCGHNVSGVHGSADGFYTGVFFAVIIAGGNNVAGKFAADFNAIFFDGGLGANLNAAVFECFDQIGGGNFFQHDISLFPE